MLFQDIQCLYWFVRFVVDVFFMEMIVKVLKILLVLCGILMVVNCTTTGNQETTKEVVTDAKEVVIADKAPQDGEKNDDDLIGIPCGPKRCKATTSFCRTQGQGACMGPKPPCSKYCQETDCGGKTVCLCASFTCVELPKQCNDCKCLKEKNPGCECKSKGAGFELNCPGA